MSQKVDQISVNLAMPKSNQKFDALRKAYTNGKFAPKTTKYVKHPQAIPTQADLIDYTAMPKKARTEAMEQDTSAQGAPTAQAQAQNTQQPQQDQQQAQGQRGGY